MFAAFLKMVVSALQNKINHSFSHKRLMAAKLVNCRHGLPLESTPPVRVFSVTAAEK
jgi:hypothetical protein